MPDTSTLVVTLQHINQEQIVLTTSDGPVVIEVRRLAAARCRVAVNAPRSVRVSRRPYADFREVTR